MQTEAKPKFTTIDEYIALQPEAARPDLELVRQTIKNTVPEAEETISYGMPAFKYHGMLVYFAANKKHFGLYPMAKAIEVFRDKLAPYEFSKGAIRFPNDRPLPVDIIQEIVRFNAAKNLEKKKK